MCLINGKIITVDPDDRVVEAIAIYRNKIEALGTTEEIKKLAGPETKIIDLKGKTVMPGIIDSHSHMGIDRGINEGSRSVVPEVRIADVIKHDDPAFFTALAGRLWCGYACPQTVWTDVFLWIERKVEGSRNQQMKRDKGGMTAEKFRLKAIKHFIWIAFSLYTGFTFVGYFTPIRELTFSMLNFSLGPWETFWVFFYGFATYGNAGWMREQVCIYMCPYARFQSALTDDEQETLSRLLRKVRTQAETVRPTI